MQNCFWVGIRESDIADTKGIYTGSITIFGSGENGNLSMEKDYHQRIDHNGSCPHYDEFFQQSMQRIIDRCPDARFVQYDALDGALFPEQFQKQFIFQNPYELLSKINSKFYQKKTLENIVPVLPYHVLPAQECRSETLKTLFPTARRAVIQRDFSCGGSGTFQLWLSDSRSSALPVPENEFCMVTAFEEHSISVNLHCVIYAEDFLLFAPSVQIINQDGQRLEYIGSDYSAFQSISQAEQILVSKTAETICQFLQAQRYLGVCGIDLLLSDGKCYLMEINPRFQASSALLNRSLVCVGFPSLQEYHQDSFCNPACSLPRPPHLASGSLIVYHFHQEVAARLHWLWNAVGQSHSFTLCDDNLHWNWKMEDGCYAFQIRSDFALSSPTFQHTLRLHPNVCLSPFEISSEICYGNLLKLKLLLLSRGVSITRKAWCAAQRNGGVDWEEFCAVTIKIARDVWITSPCMEKWQELSPLQIDVEPDDGTFFLRFYGERLMDIEIMQADPRGNRITREGNAYRDIAYLNPDRLRIYHRDGCVLQSCEKGCQFCDLFGTGKSISLSEIFEVLDAYRDEPRVSHYLIGGGSGQPKEEYRAILSIAAHIHSVSRKHIYVMSQPIEEQSALRQLSEQGVTEIAFNVEVFDETIAKRIMPGKSRHSVNDYMRCLENAAAVFGSGGEVRCAVLVGFDELEQFKAGIRRICKTGAVPMLSLFRPCADTPLENFMPVNEADAMTYYQAAKSICDSFYVRLGPSCRACQNNVIALDAD